MVSRVVLMFSPGKSTIFFWSKLLSTLFFCLVTCYKPSRRLRKSSVRMLPSSLFSPPCTPQTPYGSFVTALSVSRVSQPPSSILQVKAPNGRCCSYPISCLSYHPYPRLLPSLSLLLSDYLPNPRKRVLLTGLLATRTYSYYTLPFFYGWNCSWKVSILM